ncbi:MAG: shikimate kinase [Candidatus Pacebacteria bacterium]|nr:shikimate kinase [Candidatus Paceibacterota bacterium]
MKSMTLIGMPGSGKSTIGKLLARKLGWVFIDLDDLIKEKTGKTYSQILEQDGGKKLIEIENQFTLDLKFDKPAVFSPGGSIIYSMQAMEKLKKETTVVYIELLINEVKKRLDGRADKGGIIGLKEKGIDRLYEERAIIYKTMADFTVKTDGLNEDQIADEILKVVQK